MIRMLTAWPGLPLLPTAALLLLATGCEQLEQLGWTSSSEGLVPVDVPISFAAPEMVRIQAGDTLAILARRHQVTVADLKAWNGLTSDTIEVDQVLLIWPPARPVAVKVPARSQKPATSLSAVLGADEPQVAQVQPPPPAGTSSAPSRAPASAPVPVPKVAAGTSAPPVASPPAAPPPPPGPKVAIQRPALVALLGVTASETDLAAAAAGLQHSQAEVGNQAGLGDRALGTGGTADSLQLEKPQMRNLGPQIPDVPVTPPRLSKPAPKACLRGGATVISESGVSSSGGLTVPQINAAMGQISRHTVKCFPPGTAGSYEVIVEIKVGCDGQVDNVFLVNGGVVPARVTSCIQQTLGYASFPAHAQPDGTSFQYPMKFRF